MKFTIKNYRCFEDTKPLEFVLEKGFTALVGPNNAGKSFVLRFFYEFRNLFGILSSPNGNIVEALRGTPQGISLADVIYDSEEVFCNLNDRDMEIEVSLPVNPVKGLDVRKLLFHILRSSGGRSVQMTLDIWVGDQKIDVGSFSQFEWQGNVLLAKQKDPPHIADFSNVFEQFRTIANSIYLASFRNAINVGGRTPYFDIDVGTEFIKKWRQWKSGSNKSQQAAIQRVSRDIQDIFKYESLEILDSEDFETLQVYTNGKGYKLNELGSGIAQFILVLANAAMKKPGFIFIDEPELHLHPTLQLQFLTTLGAYAKEGVVFATHLVGLARSAAERIYSVTKDGGGRTSVSDFEQTPNLAELLGELSFSSFRALGFDKILLVEGVTEVKTIQQFLRKLKKDQGFVLIPLGGSQLINAGRELELSEIQRISDHIAALIDSEREAEDAPLPEHRQGFIEACDRLGIKAYPLQRRAIENYFSEAAIQRVVGTAYRALGAYQSLKDANPSWPKAENWKIAREMNFEEIAKTDLGKFLTEL